MDDRGRRRRSELIEATLRVIARDGLDAVTHRAVAAEAGVPLGATTYYFSSKAELVAEALRRVAADEVTRIEAASERLAASSSPRRLADALIDLTIEALEPDPAPFVAQYALWLEAARRPELRPLALGWQGAYWRAAEQAMRALGSSAPAKDARLLVATLDGLGEDILVADDPVSAARGQRAELRRLVAALAAA